MNRVLALLSVFALTACNAPETEPAEPSDVTVRHVDVEGRTVTCVTYRVDRGGGISCDWGGVR